MHAKITLIRPKLKYMINAVFCDAMPRSSCQKRCIGRTYRLHHLDETNQCSRNTAVIINRSTLLRNKRLFLRSVLRLIVTDNVVPSSPIFVALLI
jgi:hypothetical protein